MTPEEFCIAESTKLALSMSCHDAGKFLTGLILLAGDAAEVQSLRLVVARRVENDAQLELIASGQLKLRLDGKDGAQP